MNKQELIQEVISTEEISHLKPKDVKLVVSTILNAIVKGIISGTLKLSDIGTFKIVERAERMARNPKTGEKIKVPAKKKIKFTPSQKLLEKINN